MGIGNSTENTLRSVNNVITNTVAKAFQSVNNRLSISQNITVDCTQVYYDFNQAYNQCITSNANRNVDDILKLCQGLKDPDCGGNNITINGSVVYNSNLTQNSEALTKIQNEVDSSIINDMQQQFAFTFNSDINNTIENISSIINDSILAINQQMQNSTELSQNVQIYGANVQTLSVEAFSDITQNILQNNKMYNDLTNQLASDITNNLNQLVDGKTIAIIGVVIAVVILSIGISIRIATRDSGGKQTNNKLWLGLLGFLLVACIACTVVFGIRYSESKGERDMTLMITFSVCSGLLLVGSIVLFYWSRKKKTDFGYEENKNEYVDGPSVSRSKSSRTDLSSRTGSRESSISQKSNSEKPDSELKSLSSKQKEQLQQISDSEYEDKHNNGEDEDTREPSSSYQVEHRPIPFPDEDKPIEDISISNVPTDSEIDRRVRSKMQQMYDNIKQKKNEQQNSVKSEKVKEEKSENQSPKRGQEHLQLKNDEADYSITQEPSNSDDDLYIVKDDSEDLP